MWDRHPPQTETLKEANRDIVTVTQNLNNLAWTRGRTKGSKEDQKCIEDAGQLSQMMYKDAMEEDQTDSIQPILERLEKIGHSKGKGGKG